MKTRAGKALAALTVLSTLAWVVLTVVGLVIGATAYPSPEDLASAASASGTASGFLMVAIIGGAGLLVVLAVDELLATRAAEAPVAAPVGPGDVAP